LFTAAAVHYRVTGKTNFLPWPARRRVLEETFKNRRRSWRQFRLSVALHGAGRIISRDGESRYLELAKKLLAMRDLVKDGGSDNQDRIPFEKQNEAEAMPCAPIIFTRARRICFGNRRHEFVEAAGGHLDHVVTEKMLYHRRLRRAYDGAAPDGSKEQKTITRIHQLTAGIINCRTPRRTTRRARTSQCAVELADVPGDGRGEVHGRGRTGAYNSVLSGVSRDGTNFFYTNPLRVTEPLPVDLRWSRQRVPFMSSFCCPPNLIRTIAEAAGYAYGKSAVRFG